MLISIPAHIGCLSHTALVPPKRQVKTFKLESTGISEVVTPIGWMAELVTEVVTIEVVTEGTKEPVAELVSEGTLEVVTELVTDGTLEVVSTLDSDGISGIDVVSVVPLGSLVAAPLFFLPTDFRTMSYPAGHWTVN